MDLYDEHADVTFEDQNINLVAIMEEPNIQHSLLWESHKINFWVELLALDALLVQRSIWMEVNRWEREMVVLGIWGLPSLATTVAAATSHEGRVFCWHTLLEAGCESCHEWLSSFALVLARWPGCPDVIIQAVKQELLKEQF